MSNIGPQKLYELRVQEGILEDDPVQRDAVKVLEDLYQDLTALKAQNEQTWLEWLRTLGRDTSLSPKGIYMHGGVGRGKSMLMDLFYETLPEGITKRRVHFHAFMVEVHDYFHSRRTASDIVAGVDALIPSLAMLIRARSQVLCFDEFHVTDVADAMILGRLFKELFSVGVIVVATSNWEPDRLYEGGLQRERFIPFINLIKERMLIVALNSEIDYRERAISEEGAYFHPLGFGTNAKIERLFVKLTQSKPARREILSVKGRKIICPKAVDGIARFSFAHLCETPHGAEDYLKIAETYDVVFLENVPKLTYDRRNETKRFMILIDTLYEAGVTLVLSTDAPLKNLYLGHDYEYEFERTVSRLKEMVGS